MANQALIDYIMHQRVHGASVANIKNALLHAGWEEGDINKGLKATERAIDAPPPPPQAIIKPDQQGGAAATEPIATQTTAKRPPILAITLLILGIVVVAVAAVFVYMIFLRPRPATKTVPVTATTSHAAAVVITPQGDAAIPAIDTLPTPPNSEGGKVQQVPTSSLEVIGTTTSN